MELFELSNLPFAKDLGKAVGRGVSLGYGWVNPLDDKSPDMSVKDLLLLHLVRMYSKNM